MHFNGGVHNNIQWKSQVMSLRDHNEIAQKRVQSQNEAIHPAKYRAKKTSKLTD